MGGEFEALSDRSLGSTSRGRHRLPLLQPREAAAACVDGKRLHFAGDSTTRDTFYEFAAVVGHPIFAGGAGAWPDGAYEPRSLQLSGPRPQRRVPRKLRPAQVLPSGREVPIHRGRAVVVGVVVVVGGGVVVGGVGGGGGVGDAAFLQFLMRSNSTWEVEQATKMLADRRLDAAFVQCPIYEWFKPDAYNYSKSKEERARVVDVEDDLAVGPRHWAGMGVSCADYVDNVLRPAISAAGGYVNLVPSPTHQLETVDAEVVVEVVEEEAQMPTARAAARATPLARDVQLAAAFSRLCAGPDAAPDVDTTPRNRRRRASRVRLHPQRLGATLPQAHRRWHVGCALQVRSHAH